MVESFLSTSYQADMCLCVDMDDPNWSKYADIYRERQTLFLSFSEKKGTTHIINTAYRLFDNYDFFQVINDDFIYRTPGWDTIFMKTLDERGGGVAYGDDLFQGKNHCSSFFVSKNLTKTLGWLQLPSLEYLYGDTAWMVLGHNLGKLFYHPQVVIEHAHFIKNGDYNDAYAKADKTYHQTNSQEQYKKDNQAFLKWLAYQSHKDTQRLEKIWERSSSLV